MILKNQNTSQRPKQVRKSKIPSKDEQSEDIAKIT